MARLTVGEIRERLIPLYKELYDLTNPECRACRAPLSCCSREYCELAIEMARDYFGVELKGVMYRRLPFMGPTGCTLAPHLRPFCTLHTCDINGFGCSRKGPDWDKKYFRLRSKADKLMSRLAKLLKLDDSGPQTQQEYEH